MTSSGSLDSANGVKPRRSQKTTTISRRWLREEALVARVDHQVDQLRREEPAQPVDPLELVDLRVDARLQLGVPLRQLGGLPLDGVVVALHPRERGDPGEQLALVERLADEVVGARLDRADLLLVAARRDHHHRQELEARGAADPAAHLVAVHARHQDVEQHQVGARGRAASASASSPEAAVSTR